MERAGFPAQVRLQRMGTTQARSRRARGYLLARAQVELGRVPTAMNEAQNDPPGFPCEHFRKDLTAEQNGSCAMATPHDRHAAQLAFRSTSAPIARHPLVRALNQELVAHMRVGTQAGAGEQEPFETFVRDEPQVLECHDVDGEDSYVLKIRTASPQSLRRLLARIRSLPGVTRTVTSIALETIMEPAASAHLSSPEPPASKETP
jgi:DNA-binding Lrp family transcriptional regulator